MDHRKINLNAQDLEKLKALLDAEESQIDALTDEDLEAAEQALNHRLLALNANANKQKPLLESRRESEIGSSSDAGIDANWQKILERKARGKNGGPTEAADPELEGNVLPFQKKSLSLPWTTLGVIAAAALALFVIYPQMQNRGSIDADTGYPMQTKGLGVAGAGFCDIDLRGRTPEAVEEAASGNGFDVYPGEGFQMSFLCDQSGYVQVWSDGAPAAEFRNVRVNAKERSGIIVDGKEVDFSLNGKPRLNFGVVLTKEPIANDVDLLESSIPATGLGNATILWSDSIHVRGKSK